MKKLLFVLVAALFAAHSSAQCHQCKKSKVCKHGKEYKPTKGSISTEVQFNPFDQKGEMFKLDGLKVRYFLTNRDAIRLKLGFGIGHSNLSDSYDDRTDDNSTSPYTSYDTEYKSTLGHVELNLGYERHFNLSKRLSAYVGASVGFNRHFASTQVTTTETNHFHTSNNKWDSEVISKVKAEISNGAFTSLPEGDINNPLDKVSDRAYWDVKAALFTGVDFYVYKSLYLGTELGLGFNSSSLSKMKYQATTLNERDVVEFESTDNAKFMDAGIYIEPVLRLGWTF